LFLLENPELLRAMMEPVLRYAATPRWRFPFAPHDLGTYPLANGQVYGGGETSEDDQMPVEECGNMRILALAAVTAAPGGKNAGWLAPHAGRLARWADYLVEHGLDPANQLCTDDFAGRMARNANLALKAILAVGAFARLAGFLSLDGRPYRAKAEAMAAAWAGLARGGGPDGQATRLAYDAPGSWSLKYNLVWDRLLGLDLFPAEIAAAESAFYQTQMGPYGVALESRGADTKLDWQAWAACLSGDAGAFRAWMDALFNWASATPSRVPLTDWYDVETGAMRGFQARSVAGGLFMRLLAERGLAAR
jgi:hypothetical protein